MAQCLAFCLLINSIFTQCIYRCWHVDIMDSNDGHRCQLVIIILRNFHILAGWLWILIHVSGKGSRVMTFTLTGWIALSYKCMCAKLQESKNDSFWENTFGGVVALWCTIVNWNFIRGSKRFEFQLLNTMLDINFFVLQSTGAITCY